MKEELRSKKHTQATQISIPSCEIVPANSVILHKHDTWVATRFALKRSKQMESAQKWEPKVKLVRRIYKLASLEMDWVAKFITFLDNQNIEYEVI